MYKAERLAAGVDFSIVRYPTMADVAGFLADVIETPWFRHRWPQWSVNNIELRDGRGTRWARGGSGRLILPYWARTRWVILHELSHVVAGSNAKHGWLFCAVFLELITMYLGEDAGRRLRNAFRQTRCKFRKPYHRKPSAAFLAAGRANFAAFRARAKVIASGGPGVVVLNGTEIPINSYMITERSRP
jgi:putative metallohydrolase (TIGR04338 family)